MLLKVTYFLRIFEIIELWLITYDCRCSSFEVPCRASVIAKVAGLLNLAWLPRCISDPMRLHFRQLISAIFYVYPTQTRQFAKEVWISLFVGAMQIIGQSSAFFCRVHSHAQCLCLDVQFWQNILEVILKAKWKLRIWKSLGEILSLPVRRIWKLFLKGTCLRIIYHRKTIFFIGKRRPFKIRRLVLLSPLNRIPIQARIAHRMC